MSRVLWLWLTLVQYRLWRVFASSGGGGSGGGGQLENARSSVRRTAKLFRSLVRSFRRALALARVRWFARCPVMPWGVLTRCRKSGGGKAPCPSWRASLLF